MAKKQRFEDPLEYIDPIMEKAFSNSKNEPPKKRKKTQETILEEEDNWEETTAQVSPVQFPNLETEISGRKFEIDMFQNIPITVSVELGRAQISLKEVYELSEGSIIELERLVGEPLDLVVNGQVIAQGEVVAIDNNYGLRVTQINTPA